METQNTTAGTGPNLLTRKPQSRRARFAICLIIFLAAFGVRLLSWHDTRLEVGKVQTVVMADYLRVGRLLMEGGIAGFLSPSSPLNDLNTLGHPPGYSILIALTFSIFGASNTVIQIAQILGGAFTAVIIFLIVAEILSMNAAAIAGLLAALSPQLAWNSVLLLPDSLAILPILLGLFCLVRATRKPRIWTFILTGALVGISCWLRANAMLLTFFLAAAAPLLMGRGRQWRYPLAVICGTLLVVLPLTIRNAIVFHRFIPVSLGAGQTLLEGIADYDPQGKFNIPTTDVGIMKQEAEDFQRPDYYGTLFNPDGVERERARLARGFAVIRAHPFWFSGVMARRAGSMLRLERSRLVSTAPPVSHSLEAIGNLQPVWTGIPAESSFSGFTASGQAKVSRDPLTETLILTGDDSKYGEQFSSGPVNVKDNTDYVFAVPGIIERGRMSVRVTNQSGTTFSSTVVETIEHTSPEDQPAILLQLPFVTRSNGVVQVVFSNQASNPPNPIIKIGPVKLFELGPARFLWTRYLRLLVNSIQRLFLTVVVLPLALIGLALLIILKHTRALIILLVVPSYFFCVQSIVHTEYRYVLAVDYFLFAFAAVTLSWLTGLVTERLLATRTSARTETRSLRIER